MNPENKPFFNHEEETDKNKIENKEKEEYINLSFSLAADLVKQIEEGKKFDLNEYQKTCEFAVIYDKTTNEYAIWDLEDSFSHFLKELPSYFEEIHDKNVKVFFCDSKYDIPLQEIPRDSFNQKKTVGERTQRYITPDGIEYQMRFYDKKEGTELEMSYSDKEPLSVNEVKKIGESVLNKHGGRRGSKPFIEFEYSFEESI